MWTNTPTSRCNWISQTIVLTPSSFQCCLHTKNILEQMQWFMHHQKSVRPSQWSQTYIGTSQQESWGDRCGIQFKRQISNCTEAYAIELTRNPIRILSEQSRYPAEWRVSKEGWNLFRTCENSYNVKASFPCRWRFAKFNLRNACLHGLLRKGKARSNLERVCRFPAKRTKGKIK